VDREVVVAPKRGHSAIAVNADNREEKDEDFDAALDWLGRSIIC
jgi:hypothetical protein